MPSVCREGWRTGVGPLASRGRFSLCPRVPFCGRLCAGLGKNRSSASESSLCKDLLTGKIKENLHNAAQGSEVMAEGGAGKEVGEKINEKNTGLENRLTRKRKKRKWFWAAPDGLSCVACRDERKRVRLGGRPHRTLFSSPRVPGRISNPRALGTGDEGRRDARLRGSQVHSLWRIDQAPFEAVSPIGPHYLHPPLSQCPQCPQSGCRLLDKGRMQCPLGTPPWRAGPPPGHRGGRVGRSEQFWKPLVCVTRSSLFL